MLTNFAAAYFLPLAPIDSDWARRAFTANHDLREEIGWPELVKTVTHMRDSLGPVERSRLAILASNYGNLYSKDYGLPKAICGTNSFWSRGYGDPPAETLIVIGFSREFGNRYFESCDLAGRITERYGVAKEETTEHPEILICRHLRET